MTSRRAFTLIEVAVVLVVIAILAAIAIPSFTAFMDGTAERSARASAEYVVDDATGLAALEGASLPLTDAGLTTAAAETDDADGQITYDSANDLLTVDTSRGSFDFTVNLNTGELTTYTAATVSVSGFVFTNRTWMDGYPLLEVTLDEQAERITVSCPAVQPPAATTFAYSGAYPAPVSATTTHTLVMTMGPGPGLTPSGSYPGCVVSIQDDSSVEIAQTTFTLVVP